MNIKDFAEKYIKIWQQAAFSGKTGDLQKMFDPAFIYHDLFIESHLDGYLQHIRDIQKSAEIKRFELKYLVGEANLFGLDFKARYKFSAEVPGKPGTKGKEIDTHYLCFFHVKDNRIDEGWSAGISTDLN